MINFKISLHRLCINILKNLLGKACVMSTWVCLWLIWFEWKGIWWDEGSLSLTVITSAIVVDELLGFWFKYTAMVYCFSGCCSFSLRFLFLLSAAPFCCGCGCSCVSTAFQIPCMFHRKSPCLSYTWGQQDGFEPQVLAMSENVVLLLLLIHPLCIVLCSTSDSSSFSWN